MYRQDRIDGRQGGGALLLVNSEVSQWEAPFRLVTPNIQAVTCFACWGRLSMGIMCLYRAPNAGAEEDAELTILLQEFLSKVQRVVIVGDFNLPEVNWEYETAPPRSPGSALLDWLHVHALTQHVTQATRFRAGCQPSTLDLVITRYRSDVGNIIVEEPLGKSDHGVLRVSLTVKHEKPKAKLTRCFGKVNEADLRRAAEGLQWVPDCPEPTVDDRWNLIKRQILQLTEDFAPLVPRRNRQRPLWWKPKVDRALRFRRRRWTAYKTRRTFQSWNLYKLARNKAQAVQRTAKYEYELNLAKHVKQNPKRYYAYVQSQRKTREAIGTLNMPDGRQAFEEKDKADTLMAFFKSVYRQPNMVEDRAQLLVDDTVPQLSEWTVDPAEVGRELRMLNKHKVAGPDGIHPAIVQSLAEILQDPVTKLFEASLSKGELPADWRSASVVAIYKSGPRHMAKNYRPVSLTSVLCKSLERLIRRQICLHLSNHQLLSPAQHGFVAKRSCLTNLLSFMEEVTKRVDEGDLIDVCYLDFSKAFDSVSHHLLFQKLQGFGIVGQALEWIRAFLTDRTFTVKVGDYISQSATVASGVPQGSVLGPVLFVMFINDLAQDLSNPCFMFADDVKITGKELAHDIEAVHRWSTQWDLPLNVDKCQVLTSRIEADSGSGLQLQKTSEVKDLGVIITNDFKPSRQCLKAANKARGELFKLRNGVTCRKRSVFLPMYSSIVRPHLEYCVQAWAPYYQKDIDCLEKVQRLATRMIEGQVGKAYEQRLNSFELFSLKRRRMRGDLIETFKIVKGLSGLSFGDFFAFIPTNATRGHSLRLQRSHSRLEVRAHFFTNRVIPQWNILPEQVVMCTSVQAFKKALDACWSTVFPECE